MLTFPPEDNSLVYRELFKMVTNEQLSPGSIARVEDRTNQRHVSLSSFRVQHLYQDGTRIPSHGRLLLRVQLRFLFF